MAIRQSDHKIKSGQLILPDAFWPHNAPLSGEDVHAAQQHAALALQRFMADEQLPQAYISLFPRLIIPMAAWLLRQQRQVGRPLRFGVSGSQGSGKSTLSRALRLVLNHCFAVPSCVLSLDDFYRPLDERLALAQRIHPLLATRGVPGTHDMVLLMDTLVSLENAGSRQVTVIPAFDKSLDTRVAQADFARFQGRPGIVLIEGWCLGARSQSDDSLAEPVNQLEAEEDPHGTWRRYVNDQLRGDYHRLFETLDRFMFLRAPAWTEVKRWRLLQEAKLIRSSGNAYRGHLDEGDAFERFMAHYERITRQLLNEEPEADATLALDEKQRLARLSFRTCRQNNQ